MRRARLAMMVKATNDCAAASSGTETIEEKITSMVRMPGAFERQPLSTMNLCARALRHARVLRGLRSMWIATPRTSFLALSPHVSPCEACGWAGCRRRETFGERFGGLQAVCVTILAARLFLCGMNISMYLASFRRYFGAP